MAGLAVMLAGGCYTVFQKCYIGFTKCYIKITLHSVGLLTKTPSGKLPMTGCCS